VTEHPIERPCPKCGSGMGEQCSGRRGHRKSFHQERGRRPKEKLRANTSKVTESPIEHLMVSALEAWIDHNSLPGVVVETQVKCPPYRLDIGVFTNAAALAIECDGFEFHSSKAAMARDRAKDRFLAIEGYAVMRFTGTEIKRDPRGCAAQVGAWLRRRG